MLECRPFQCHQGSYVPLAACALVTTRILQSHLSCWWLGHVPAERLSRQWHKVEDFISCSTCYQAKKIYQLAEISCKFLRFPHEHRFFGCYAVGRAL